VEAPIIVKPIPQQVVNERAAYGPFDLSLYVHAPDNSPIRFSAGLSDGASLPKGLICTSDGSLTGIPARRTQGTYDLIVTAENEAGSVDAAFTFIIKPSLLATNKDLLTKLKAQVWDAINQKIAIPELTNLYESPISIQDVYYLVERFGILKIWDAFNLDPPGDVILVQIEGVSPHYNVYDRGSCLIAAPKDLFSHERTMADSLQTAQAVAREVYKRNWTIELVGLDKMMRAAWVEIQQLGDRYGKNLDIINYKPSQADMNLYTNQAINRRMISGID
jgi:hypothetical protein